MKYKALVFDFFGVVCSEIAPFWFAENQQVNAKELKEQYLHPADRGEISQEQLFKQLSTLSGIPADEIERDWVNRAILNLELIEFIKELKGCYKLGLLTNSMGPFFHALAGKAPITDLFEEVVVSSEIGYAKPEPETYREILSRLGTLPEEALMIDDNPININGAEDVGMPGLIFTSTAELRALLGNS